MSKSPPFLSDPQVLVFRDFTIGETMEIPFTMTNISFARNTYKVVGFDKEYAALFNLISSPPGFISPGVSVKLCLQFTPKYNSPIQCSIHFLTEAGPFEVQVECLPKIVNIQIEPFDQFDLGTVTLGEETEQTIIMRNTGALQATWQVSLEEAPSEPGYLSLTEAEDGIIQFSTRRANINGYSSSQIHVSFRPTRPCNLRFNMRFKFTSNNREFESFTKDLPIVGIAADVPVFLESDRIDFGICYYSQLYRSVLTAHNRSNLSQRFMIDLPHDLDKFVEFMPKMGFIQPMSSLQISIKVRTSPKFHQLFPQYDKTAEIPLVLQVVNQVLPVNFSISLTPSSQRLTFDPPFLDFGTFSNTESKTITLRITSNLELPTDFGFVRLPAGITIQPFEGFGAILPNETVEVQITFHSILPKKHDLSFNIYTLQGGSFQIKGTANIQSSPLLFSSTNIDFEATPLGNSTPAKITITNTKTSPIDIHFETPDDFFFDPVVATIQPGSTIPVSITFKPNIPIAETKPVIEEEPTDPAQLNQKANGKTTPTGKREKKQHKDAPSRSHHKDKTKKETLSSGDIIEEPRCLISPDFTYKLYDHSIACFWKCGNQSDRQHLHISASSILPTIFVSSVRINKKERTSNSDFIDLALNTINFGTVATGQFVDAIITIKSMIRKTISLISSSKCGTFEVLSPTTELKGLQSAIVRVRFSPTANLKYASTVIFSAIEKPNMKITLKLFGEGAAPAIALSSDTLDFGHVVVGQTIQKGIQVKNNANFALKYVYKLVPEPGMHTKNMSGTEAFNIVQESQWLKPNETGEAIVAFSPDHDDLGFGTKLIISAGEDGESREVPVLGSSWPHVMYIMGGVEEERQRTAFDHYALDEAYFRPNVIVDLAYPGAGASGTITIGIAAQNDDAKKANGEFVIDNITIPGFTVTPMKSSIEAGGNVKVLIEYAPPASSLLQVGQWVVADTFLNLKFGEFMKKVPLKLRCLINLQQSVDFSQTTTQRAAKGNSKRRSRK